MQTDHEIQSAAMQLLRKHLGLIETERFLVLVARQSFDYTKWRQTLWLDSTVANLAQAARELRSSQKNAEND